MVAFVADSPCAKDPHTLDIVEQQLVSKSVRLRFEATLERRYAADTLEQRRQFLTAVGIAGGLIYNLFLINDWLTLRDAFPLVAWGRVGVISPLVIILLFVSQLKISRAMLEGLAAFGSVASAVMPLVVLVYSDSPYRLHYQLGTLLTMVYCATIQRLPLHYVAVALGCMVATQLVATYLAGFMDLVVWQANSLFFISAAVLMVVASYFLERGSRKSYLFALRGSLLQAQLIEMARTDPLTRLFNRRYQGEVTASIWERALDSPSSVAVILLDIDHFKAYNDSYGHMQGDTCLKLLSKAIEQTSQEHGAMAFRFGGEEILVLLANATANNARLLAESLRVAVMSLAIPHPVMGESAKVTISLGMAIAVIPQTSADALIGSADAALYAAKKAGRNCLCCARPNAV